MSVKVTFLRKDFQATIDQLPEQLHHAEWCITIVMDRNNEQLQVNCSALVNTLEVLGAFRYAEDWLLNGEGSEEWE